MNALQSVMHVLQRLWMAAALSVAGAPAAWAIGGGENLKPENYVHTGLLGLQVTFQGRSTTCTATMVNDGTVLTAASCFDGVPQGAQAAVTLVRGPDLNAPDAIRMEVPMEQVVLHPEYRESRGARRDFAVLKLRLRVPGTARVHLPRPLASFAADYYGFSGYGSDAVGFAGVLKKIFATKADVDAAATAHGDYLVFRHARGVGTCEGDAGGPVVVNFSDTLYLVGINAPVPAGDEKCPGRSRVLKLAPAIEWLQWLMQSDQAPPPDDPKVAGGGGKP
ncbi:MAG: trypsin-like serine protease [Burkholderiales bacterium]